MAAIETAKPHNAVCVMGSRFCKALESVGQMPTLADDIVEDVCDPWEQASCLTYGDEVDEVTSESKGADTGPDDSATDVVEAFDHTMTPAVESVLKEGESLFRELPAWVQRYRQWQKKLFAAVDVAMTERSKTWPGIQAKAEELQNIASTARAERQREYEQARKRRKSTTGDDDTDSVAPFAADL